MAPLPWWSEHSRLGQPWNKSEKQLKLLFWMSGSSWLVDQNVWLSVQDEVSDDALEEISVKVIIAPPLEEKQWLRLSKWTHDLEVSRRLLS